MIEVGKVVTRREYDDKFYRYGSTSGWVEDEWVTIQVGAEGVALRFSARTNPAGTRGAPSKLSMTPEQAIEIAQLLMKAAESQAEYAAARQELLAEMNKLDESFKDRISGLGINHVTEPETSVKSAISHKSGSVIIVEVE